jgi:hypothetical protein
MELSSLNPLQPLIQVDVAYIWMISWSNEKYKFSHPEIHNSAKNIVNYLIKQRVPDYDKPINFVKTVCNYGNVNVMAQINDDLNIITFNKANYTEDEKINMLRNLIELYSKANTGKELVPIYYSRARESKSFLTKIQKIGWLITNKKLVIELIKNHKEIVFQQAVDLLFDE